MSGDHAIEREALRLLWATLRLSLAPELVSALAKDRAKRSDAALARLVAGYAQLPAARTRYQAQYEELLARSRSLAAGAAAVTPAAQEAADNPLFVGIPEIAPELEARMLALELARDRSAPALDALIRDITRLEATCRQDYEARVFAMKPALGGTISGAPR